MESSARGAAARGFPKLTRALDVLQSRIADPPGLEELVALCQLSPAQFSRLVRLVFQLTPRQLVMKARLDEALHLLATTPHSLTDIALSTGFCDQSTFAWHFRRFARLRPGRFGRPREKSAELRASLRGPRRSRSGRPHVR